MPVVTFKDTPVDLSGDFPVVGQKAPDFTLIGPDLAEVTLSSLSAKRVVFNIFPSVDTPVCALQLKTFCQRAAALDNTVLLFASMDLPFAMSRFCGAEGIDNALTASDFRHRSLADNYGIMMTSGPLAGLYARATLVLDSDHTILHAELVPEIAQEPDYDAALAVLSA